tara:strand:- start:24 stop:182 length:159 start_codon:yes stop_codon:yes gene_type:complete
MLCCPLRPTLKWGKSGSGFFLFLLNKKIKKEEKEEKGKFCGNNLVLRVQHTK